MLKTTPVVVNVSQKPGTAHTDDTQWNYDNRHLNCVMHPDHTKKFRAIYLTTPTSTRMYLA